MTAGRMVGLLIGLGVIGIAVVAIRVDQARSLAHIQQMQFEQARLEREIATQRMELARLRAPGMVRERAARLGLTAEGILPDAMSKQPTPPSKNR